MVHILVYEKPQQIRPWPWPWPLILTLKSSPKFKIFETYQLRKANQNMLGYYAQVIIYCWHQKSRSRSSKSQIHIIGYNFTSNCHRAFKLGSYLDYEKSYQIWPWPWPLTLTLKSSPKVKIFETYQLRKTCQNMLGYYEQSIIYCWQSQSQGQGQAKGQIHIIGYNFAYNCHRDLKLGLYFCFWKAAPNMTFTLTFDLDLESLPKVKIMET